MFSPIITELKHLTKWTYVFPKVNFWTEQNNYERPLTKFDKIA